jgi:hypothetical protein
MTSLLDTLTRTFDDGMAQDLSRTLEVPADATRDAMQVAVPLLVAALARNAAQPGGADALAGALDRDHDGSLLEDLQGFLGNPGPSRGGAILGHVLGGRQPAVEQGIAKRTGLDAAKVGQILQVLAPLVLAALARARQSKPGAQASPGGLSDLLQGELGRMLGRAGQRAPAGAGAGAQAGGGLGGILGGMLDADGDGNIADDIANRGFDMLRGMFR